MLASHCHLVGQQKSAKSDLEVRALRVSVSAELRKLAK